ncbi:MAG: tRNA pseudouridine(38-40) synthase TruA [Ruminococcaceae bacterium]|nr:tRNA pseudouridine(38-40) synthase TruA [Oscillospiraceae bacterium]
MRHIALLLSFDGTQYHGWQIQSNATTVQGTLCDALVQVAGVTAPPVGCGRTDAGVHAEYYVADFFTESKIPLDRFPVALNTVLPHDIVVHKACEVSDDFHAVHSCIRKEYTYRMYTAKTPNPFLHNRALFYPYPLDLESLCHAAQNMVGTHDFAAMRSLGTPVKSTVRTVYEFDITQNGNEIAFRIAANGFLYNMARTMVGTLLAVAQKKFSPDEIPSILESGDRSRAGATAPACGLYMTHSDYGKELFHA